MSFLNTTRAAIGLRNPIYRMRRERRVALLLFNLFLLLAALIQILGLSAGGVHSHEPPLAPPASVQDAE